MEATENNAIIAEFISLNATGINEMIDQSPEIGEAFAGVIAVLATRYGNIVIPPTVHTPTPEPTGFKKWTFDNLRNKKFKVKNFEEAELLQRFLFSLGFEWRGNIGQNFAYTGEKYFFTGQSTYLEMTKNKSTFDQTTKKEITLEELGLTGVNPTTSHILRAAPKITLEDIKGTKYRIGGDEEYSAQLQQLFFDLGAEWRGGGTQVTDLKAKYLFVDVDPYNEKVNITRADVEDVFEDSVNTEYSKEEMQKFLKQSPKTFDEPELSWANMTQDQLKAKLFELQDALDLFDEDDPEYQGIQLEIDTIKLLIND